MATMTNSSNNSSQKPSVSQRIKVWARENLVPDGVNIYLEYRRAVKDSTSMPSLLDAQREAKERVRSYLGKTVAAAGMYRIMASFYGVGAWDMGLKFNATDTWMKDASPLAVSIVSLVSGLVPTHKVGMFADIAMGAEAALSLIRTYVEQRLWRKYKLTPNPQGTAMTPFVDAIVEFGYKFGTGYYSTPDDNLRLRLGLIGAYGNLARLATDAILYIALRSLDTSATDSVQTITAIKPK